MRVVAAFDVGRAPQDLTDEQLRKGGARAEEQGRSERGQNGAIHRNIIPRTD